MNLKTGETVWIESRRYSFLDGSTSRQIREAKVVKANKSSAYVVEKSDLEKEKPFEYRVDQKTFRIKNTGIFGYQNILWLSKEDFERDVKYENELKINKEKLLKKVNESNDLEKIKKALETLN